MGFMKKAITTSAFFYIAAVHAQSANDAVNCVNELASNQELVDLKEKVSIGQTQERSFAVITQQGKPSTLDRRLIIKWVELRNGCYPLGETFRSRLPALMQSEEGRRKSDFEIAAALLVEGKITYGDFAKKRIEIDDRYEDAWTSWRRQAELSRQQRKAVASQQPDGDRNLGKDSNLEQNEKKNACDNARKNMDSFCGQARAAQVGNQPSVVVNIGATTYSPPPTGGVDLGASYNCGYWQSKTTQLCN